mgnify:CR=1 FL=1
MTTSKSRPIAAVYDETALAEAVRVSGWWKEAARIYNAATGQNRTVGAIKGAAALRGLKLGRVPRANP